jgi:hypothetical protein
MWLDTSLYRLSMALVKICKKKTVRYVAVQTLELPRAVKSDSRYTVFQLSQVQLAVSASLPGLDRDSRYTVFQLSQVQLAVSASLPGPDRDSRYTVFQLSQVQLAVSASLPGPDRDSLVSLQTHIEELITLTKENLTGLQNQAKERDLLQTEAGDQYDEEYALLKVS